MAESPDSSRRARTRQANLGPHSTHIQPQDAAETPEETTKNYGTLTSRPNSEQNQQTVIVTPLSCHPKPPDSLLPPSATLLPRPDIIARVRDTAKPQPHQHGARTTSLHEDRPSASTRLSKTRDDKTLQPSYTTATFRHHSTPCAISRARLGLFSHRSRRKKLSLSDFLCTIRSELVRGSPKSSPKASTAPLAAPPPRPASNLQACVAVPP